MRSFKRLRSSGGGWPTWALLAAAAIVWLSSGAAAMAASDYVVGCTLFRDGGEPLRSFPGKLCLFLKDGSLIVAGGSDPGRLARYDGMGKEIWARSLFVHDQLKLSEDGRRILTLGADVREGDLGRVRYDDFLILSARTGATLHRWSGYEHRMEYLKLVREVPARVRPAASREGLDYLYEYTHFNSIAEIPENPPPSAKVAFRKGDFLVGLNGLGTFAILDSRLEGIRWSMHDPEFDGDVYQNDRSFEDLEMLSNGHLKVFYAHLARSDAHPFVVREIDPVTGKLVSQQFLQDATAEIRRADWREFLHRNHGPASGNRPGQS